MSRRQDWRVGEECALLLEESENSIWKRHRAAAYEGMISGRLTTLQPIRSCSELGSMFSATSRLFQMAAWGCTAGGGVPFLVTVA